MSHEQVVEPDSESLQNVGVTRCEMCHSVLGEGDYSGTVVQVGADDPGWLAESFKPAITKFFRDWTKVRIQALTFNGEPIFDYRLWPEPHEQEVVRDFYGPEPIMVKVREANIPEWKETI